MSDLSDILGGLRKLGLVIVLLAVLAAIVLIAGALGNLTLAAALTLRDHAPRAAFVFNGIPWIYLLYKILGWIWSNLEEQFRSQLR